MQNENGKSVGVKERTLEEVRKRKAFNVHVVKKDNGGRSIGLGGKENVEGIDPRRKTFRRAERDLREGGGM